MILRGMGELLARWRLDLVVEVLDPYAASLDELL
jgi:hypothetical protein